MSKYVLIVLPMLASLLLASCAGTSQPSFAAELRAKAWESKLRKDVPSGSPASKVEAYLRANGAKEIRFTANRQHLLAADSIELKRYFPPWPVRNSVQIDRSFSAGERLAECLAVPSAQACCSR